jgi:hypothetical protein
MVHQSMRNCQKVADELSIKRMLLALEDFVFFSLYSFSCIAKQLPTFEQLRLLSCPDFLDANLERILSCFDTVFKSSMSPAPDPTRYKKIVSLYSQSQPQIIYPNWLDYGLKVLMVNFLNVEHNADLIVVSKLALSFFLSLLPHLLESLLNVYL